MGDAATLKQADLLGFLVFHRGLAAQRVQVVVAEIFLCELFGANSFGDFDIWRGDREPRRRTR